MREGERGGGGVQDIEYGKKEKKNGVGVVGWWVGGVRRK